MSMADTEKATYNKKKDEFDEELEAWDKLSDEALSNFENNIS